MFGKNVFFFNVQLELVIGLIKFHFFELMCEMMNMKNSLLVETQEENEEGENIKMMRKQLITLKLSKEVEIQEPVLLLKNKFGDTPIFQAIKDE